MPTAAKPTPKSVRHRKPPSAIADGAAEQKSHGDEDGGNDKPPQNESQVLSRVALEGLPCPSTDTEAAIVQLLSIKYDQLAHVFAHYCRYSDCATVHAATRRRTASRT